MSTPIGRVSDLVAQAMAAFELVTGYMVIASEEVVKTYAIDPGAHLLEVRPNLSDNHLVAVLIDAQRRIGCPGANRFLGDKLGEKLSAIIDLGAA